MNGDHRQKRRKTTSLRNRGISTPGCLLSILLIAVLAYVGFKVGEAYWSYYQVRERVREVLTWAAAGMQPKSEAEIVRKVIAGASKEGVQLKSRNVNLTQTADTLTITVSWSHELEFPNFTFPLNLEVNLTEAKRWGRGGLLVK